MSAGPAVAPVVAIVLAGGRGVRLGRGVPKAMVALAGRTLLERAVELGAGVAGVVLVAAPAGLALALPAAASRVDDLAADAGPLAGLVPALERAAALGAREAFVFAVDLPGLTTHDLAALVRAAGPGTMDAAIPRGRRGLEPQVAYVAAVGPVAAAFRAAWNAGERSLQGAFLALGPRLGTIDATAGTDWPGGENALRGVNTPQEFARAERAALEAKDAPT